MINIRRLFGRILKQGVARGLRPASKTIRHRRRPAVEALETRVTPSTSGDVLSALNDGVASLATLGPAIAAQGLGSDVPLVRETFAQQLHADRVFQQLAQPTISNPQTSLAD